MSNKNRQYAAAAQAISLAVKGMNNSTHWMTKLLFVELIMRNRIKLSNSIQRLFDSLAYKATVTIMGPLQLFQRELNKYQGKYMHDKTDLISKTYERMAN